MTKKLAAFLAGCFIAGFASLSIISAYGQGGGLGTTGVQSLARVSGITSGCKTALGTPSSANFRGCVTDESGTGALLFAGGNIGAATGTSLGLPAFGSNAGTATSNTLTGYEEGTWTPVLTGWTNVGSPTLTGTYTRIGRLVFLTFQITPATSISSTVATSYVSGLPYTPSANAVIPGQDASTLSSTVSGFVGTLGRLYVGSITVTSDTYVWTGSYYK